MSTNNNVTNEQILSVLGKAKKAANGVRKAWPTAFRQLGLTILDVAYSTAFYICRKNINWANSQLCVYYITKNIVLDAFRQRFKCRGMANTRGREISIHDCTLSKNEVDDHNLPVETQYQLREFAKQVRSIISRLSIAQQKVLEYALFCNSPLSVPEMCAENGITESWYYLTCRKGRAFIKSELAKMGIFGVADVIG